MPYDTPQDVEKLFTAASGAYHFARWGRPIAPVVFGVEDETIALIKAAFHSLCGALNHPISETDPELGSNLMIFFCHDWDELAQIKDLDHIIPDMKVRLMRLKSAQATQYRFFRFDAQGGIRACFVFLCMSVQMQAMPADVLVQEQAARSLLLWSQEMLQEKALAQVNAQGQIAIHCDALGIMRAAYDPLMPPSSKDKSHALRLWARFNKETCA